MSYLHGSSISMDFSNLRHIREADADRIGNLDELITDNKQNLVYAINEVADKVKNPDFIFYIDNGLLTCAYEEES